MTDVGHAGRRRGTSSDMKATMSASHVATPVPPSPTE
jgi:hypothetical protein